MMKKFYTLITLCLLLTSFLQAQVIWDNFEDIRRGTYGFINGTFIPYNENPDKTGINTSEVAAAYTRNGAETFDVLIVDGLMADVSDYLTDTKQMSIDVWSPAVGKTVQITLENTILAQPGNFPTGRHSEYTATTTVANAWETLTFEFSNRPDATVANDNVDRIVLLFDPNSNNADTYYWDNLSGPELAEDPCDGVMRDPEILNDFECNQNVNFVFSHAGVNFRRVINQDQSSGNLSEYTAIYTRNAGEENDVIIGRFGGTLNVGNDSEMSLVVRDPTSPTRVVVSLQNAMGDVILEMSDTTSVSNAWETLTFDPSPVAAATDITQFVILFDPGNNSSDMYYFDDFKILGGLVSTQDLAQEIAFSVAPNPSRGLTNFEYELPSASQVNLSIHDLTGKIITQVFNGRQQAGQHRTTWNADHVPNGIYFYSLSVDGKTTTGKIAIHK